MESSPDEEMERDGKVSTVPFHDVSRHRDTETSLQPRCIIKITKAVDPDDAALVGW